MIISVGTAGWGIPREVAEHFPSDGSGLSRYASLFSVAEINSSFHRAHQLSTWQRWHDAVPDAFRFSVKVPKLITHTHKLIDVAELLDDFVAQAGVLGDKLAILLVQLPPKLEFDHATARRFFEQLAERSDAAIACEPRHPSWFTPAADALLEQFRVARVAADPAICDVAAVPGGWAGLAYWRLHGSPVIYRSSYRDRIADYASKLQAGPADDVWCIFDNTAASAGAGDAVAMLKQLRS